MPSAGNGGTNTREEVKQHLEEKLHPNAQKARSSQQRKHHHMCHSHAAGPCEAGELLDPQPNPEDNSLLSQGQELPLPTWPDCSHPKPALLPASPGNGVRMGCWVTTTSTKRCSAYGSVCGGGIWHGSFASPGCPCCWSSSPSHCRMQYCSCGPREGRCCFAALLRRSALSSECNYPKHSHKTQFTIPAAFWHPGVLAYRQDLW